jgi:predicted RNA-binding Zn ribbon-like protein
VRTGQWLTGRDGRRWFFDSGSLALDFGYTGDYGYGVAEWERLHTPADLSAWLTERFDRLAAPARSADLAEALRLRAVIVRMAHALADGRPLAAADIDELNNLASPPPVVPHLPGGTIPPPPVTVAAALSTIARDAIATFASGSSRVRRCSAGDCALIFYDASRPNARRWCSMQRCGNRSKVRGYRSRNNQEET